MKIVTLIARILLLLVSLLFGLNGFLNFLNIGPMPAGLAGQFMTRCLSRITIGWWLRSKSQAGCYC
jgi:hypothetical protein